jgi:hypothetical protein
VHFINIAQANHLHIGQLSKPVKVVGAHTIQTDVSHPQSVARGHPAGQARQQG